METRGNLWFLLPMGLLALVLFLDIKFPLLFWNLNHGLAGRGMRPVNGTAPCRKSAAI